MVVTINYMLKSWLMAVANYFSPLTDVHTSLSKIIIIKVRLKILLLFEHFHHADCAAEWLRIYLQFSRSASLTILEYHSQCFLKSLMLS